MVNLGKAFEHLNNAKNVVQAFHTDHPEIAAALKKKALSSMSGGRRKQIVKIGPLKKGTLRKHGYSLAKKSKSRRRSLVSAVKSIGYAPVVHKLNAVAILQKNTHPKNSKKFKSDIRYLRKKYRSRK